MGSWKNLSWNWFFKAEQNWTRLVLAQLFTAQGRLRLCLMLIFTTLDFFLMIGFVIYVFVERPLGNKVALVLTWPLSGRLGGRWSRPALVHVLS